MGWIGSLAALALIGLMLVDGFEAMVLPRRVARTYRPARLFYRVAWALWRRGAHAFAAGRRRQMVLSVFGPLSLLALFAVWVAGLICGFALLHLALGTPLTQARDADYATYLYFSGTTFFTLGYGDVTPEGTLGRGLSVVEAGLGFAFLALIIGYLPVLYQAFSRREVTISLLDARAGSPPTAAQVLTRLGGPHNLPALAPLLAEWERWAAELLESNLSFPLLSYYRSQHDNQSWVAALTAMLDTCALLLAGWGGADGYQARLTFAMARHAAVDLALVFKTPPRPPVPDRLPADALARLAAQLRSAGLAARDDAAAAKSLAELRGLYEPFVNALADHFLFALPPLLPEKPPVDNWQTSAWAARSPGLGALATGSVDGEHFD